MSADPWYFFEVPDPPEKASYPQLIDHAAVLSFLTSSVIIAADELNGTLPEAVIRVIRAYMQRWHPDVELPE